MKRMTAVLAVGSVGVVGLALAMPALADATSGSPSPSSASSAPLTQAQKDDILDFLADHPQLGQALAARAAGWEKFLAAHPDIKAELAKVLALPADQRRAELQKWLAAHPDAKAALKAYRQGLKEQRLTRQRDRLDRRIQRLQGRMGGGSAGSGSSSGSSSPASPSLFATT
jgi:hemophore-related protein